MNQYVTNKLKVIGFIQSKWDPCVFWRNKVIYNLYTDDSLIAGASQAEIDKVINLSKGTGLKITEEGVIGDFVGVHIHRTLEGTLEH